MRKVKIKIVGFILILTQAAFSQINNYNYTREIKAVTKEQWHHITIPTELFEKVKPDLSDLRIYGFNDNDTIEAPYLLRSSKGEQVEKTILFNLLNQSRKGSDFYFTFETPVAATINQLKLNFRQDNFDWRLKLEGSMDQREWFSIVEDYRILSIKKEGTDFQFTTVLFPPSRYIYFRALIKSDQKPDLLNASFSLREEKSSSFREYALPAEPPKEDKINRTSIIPFSLPYPVSLADIQIVTRNTYDYYRGLTVEYLTDSIRTPQGWVANYRVLTSGTLSSLGENRFSGNGTVLKRGRILIYNQDNQPLKIDSLILRSYTFDLNVRLTHAARYFLVYGNKNALPPAYDLQHFKEQVPAQMAKVELGPEQRMQKNAPAPIHPLFENKLWLWIILIALIVILGTFSLKMIKKAE
jgi:hypothetical protein